MTKYFLNIRQSGKSDDREGNITYKFDLESPLLFPSSRNEKHEFKHLEIKTNQDENEFYRNINGRGEIGGHFSPIEIYWNLCVPDDNKGFSLLADNDKLTLGNEEGKIYLEPFHFPHSTLLVRLQAIFTVVKGESLNITIEPSFKVDKGIEVDQIELEGAKFTTQDYQSLIQNIINNKKELKFSFCPNNNTYFSKALFGSKKNNVLVIPENSLQEDLTIYNPNNSSPRSDKYFYFLVVGIVVLILLLLLFLFFLIKRQKFCKK